MQDRISLRMVHKKPQLCGLKRICFETICETIANYTCSWMSDFKGFWRFGSTHDSNLKETFWDDAKQGYLNAKAAERVNIIPWRPRSVNELVVKHSAT
jgi:hypothetical protein